MASRSVFLIGFAASGKSTVGKLVAEKLGLPFVDLDNAVEAEMGISISQAFAEHGEEFFREKEKSVLASLVGGEAKVMATGGGTACLPDAVSLLRKNGLVVFLHADLEDCVARARAASAKRPLMSMSSDELSALYADRQSDYRQAHVVIASDTEINAASSVCKVAMAAEEISDVELSGTTFVATGRHICPVVVSRGVLQTANARLEKRDRPYTGIAVVTDTNVGPLYAEKLLPEASAITLPAGEQSKSLSQFANLQDRLIEQGLDRGSAVLALGGGVIGDLAGFAASTLFRGIPLVQIPTSVLAMVDSSVGGKTGVNTDGGKNLVGAFWQPDTVLVDPNTLKTLPVEERQAAFGEVLKYGLLDGPNFLADVERNANEFARTGEVSDSFVQLIVRCIQYKAWAVTLDEREKYGVRAFLNLGHTVGHAIEASAGYGVVAHGRAVALGLLATCRVSKRLGVTKSDLESKVADILRIAGIEPEIDRWLQKDVLRWVNVDKKRTGDQLHFIALEDVGKPTIQKLSVNELETALL